MTDTIMALNIIDRVIEDTTKSIELLERYPELKEICVGQITTLREAIKGLEVERETIEKGGDDDGRKVNGH